MAGRWWTSLIRVHLRDITTWMLHVPLMALIVLSARGKHHRSAHEHLSQQLSADLCLRYLFRFTFPEEPEEKLCSYFHATPVTRSRFHKSHRGFLSNLRKNSFQAALSEKIKK